MEGIFMDKNHQMDLKIHGQGSSSGGKYDNVSIMGEGKVHGDIDCINLKIYGEGKFGGNLKAGSTVDIKGHSNIKGNLEAKKVKIQGEAEINGEIFAEEAVITGNIRTDGDCNAETFTLDGGFTIGGLLNADILKINLHLPCKVHEIGGAEITIKKGKLNFFKNRIIHTGGKELTADIIEGDDIYLENTHAKVVRGNNITLGSGCEIELVEYKNDFKQDKEAKIDTHQKI